ncbi:hypothetical protein AEJ54_30225, partial [Azospirillum sp. Sp 7]
EAGPDAEAPPADQAPPRPATILLVEDEALVRMATATVLEQSGFRIMEASSGPDALDVFARDPEVDLVLTDYAMPGMTGLELVRELRARRPGLPVLMVTGYAEIQRASALDGLPILQKPYQANELVARIRAALPAAPPA